MYQFLVSIYKYCKLFFPCSAVASSNIIPINASVSGWYIEMLQIIFPIQLNFVTIHETGSSSSKIIKEVLGKESLKHLSSVS